MDLITVKETITLFEASSLAYLKIEEGEQKLTLKRATAPLAPVSVPVVTAPPAPVPAAPQPDEGLYSVKAPVVGVFYAAKSPGAPPLVTPGQQVNKGDVLCLVEAMKNISEIQSPVSGIVRSVLVENQAFIQFDQPLFLVEESPC